MATDPAKWMEQTLDFSKTLKEISIPGSHDAGMYTSSNCSPGAASCNTETQKKPMLGQLEAGMRYFDLRPVWTNGAFCTGHFSNVDVLGGQGCTGGTLMDIFTGVNEFLSRGHKELVILKLSHDYDRDADRFSFNESQLDALIDLVTRMLGKWLYLNDTGNRLAAIPLSRIIGSSGKVIAVFDRLPDQLVRSGIYQYSDYSPRGDQPGIVSGALSIYDEYSDTNDFDFMRRDQLGKLDCPVNHGGDLFLLSWTLTQSPVQASGCLIGAAASIIALAEKAIESIVPDLRGHGITSANVPNIVYLDVSPVQATAACIEVNQRLGNNV